MSEYDKIEIVERYKDYTPPFDVKAEIRKALRIVPENLLNGLETIILVSSGAMSREERRSPVGQRKNRSTRSKALGIQYERTVELYVDKIIKKTKYPSDPIGQYIFIKYDMIEISRVLFHEVGHYIHKYKKPENGDIEKIAIRYENQYAKRYNRGYTYLIPLALLYFGTKISTMLLLPWKWKKLYKGIKNNYRDYKNT